MELATRRRILLAGLTGAAALALNGCGGGSGLSGLMAGSTENAEAPAEEQPPVDMKLLMEAGPLGERTLGKPGAPVTVIEYVSLTCPVCAAFHKNTLPQFKKAYIDTGKVYFIHREFPIGRSSAAASVAVRCAPEKQFFKLTERFLMRQPDWVAQEIKHDAIYNIVKDSGMKRPAFDSCLTNQAINDGLIFVKQRGRALGVVATPTFFINGKKIRGGLSFEELQKEIDPLLAAPAAPPAQAQAPGRPA